MAGRDVKPAPVDLSGPRRCRRREPVVEPGSRGRRPAAVQGNREEGVARAPWWNIEIAREGPRRQAGRGLDRAGGRDYSLREETRHVAGVERRRAARRRGGKRGDDPRAVYRQRSAQERERVDPRDRKSTRLNSSHANISYAVFCL